MEIKRYTEIDYPALIKLLRDQGEDWAEYWGEGRAKYENALKTSTVYLAVKDNGELAGYVRCRDDDGFGVYIYDLLVKPSCRGAALGKLLMEKVCSENPDTTVYVMSDVDLYYQKLGYHKEGSIFIVKPKTDKSIE